MADEHVRQRDALRKFMTDVTAPTFDEEAQVDASRGAKPAERWGEFVYNSIVEKGRPEGVAALRSEMNKHPEMIAAIKTRVREGVASHPGNDGALVGSGRASAALRDTRPVCTVIVNPVYRDGELRGTSVSVRHTNLDLRAARNLEANLMQAESGFKQSDEPNTMLSFESPKRLLLEVAQQTGAGGTERVYHVEDVTFIDLDGVESPRAPKNAAAAPPPASWLPR